MNISFRITIILIMLFAIIAPRCHGAVLLDDFAGLRKSVNQGPIWAPDPSRIFATPGGGGHPEGSTVAMPTAKAEQAAKPEVKPEAKPEPKPPCPKPPIVKPPKDEPKHKCWPFKFKPFKPTCNPEHKPVCKPVKVKPDCKHESARPDKKPSCGFHGPKKSQCSKPSGHKPCGKFGGHKGMNGHSKGHCGKR